jgi:uncharacterized membrane protein YphA (DoxX/SURF4 family)
MDALSLDLARAGRPLLATLAGVAVVIAVVSAVAVPGLTVLWTAVVLAVAGTAVVGLFLIFRAQRPLAGAGAIVVAVSIVLAYTWRTSPAGVVWTVALLAGAALVIRGTRQDTASRWWPLLLPRLIVGWAFIDNGVNDMVWLPGGGGFLSAATAALKREPSLLDGGYQPFLQTVVMPRPDTFAGLFLGGELIFGLLLVLGLFGAVGASGAMWLSANIILEKSFMSHGAYVDKTYFVAELFCLIAAAGFVYGLDASLRRYLPPGVSRWLAGAEAGPGGTRPMHVPSPASAT